MSLTSGGCCRHASQVDSPHPQELPECNRIGTIKARNADDINIMEGNFWTVDLAALICIYRVTLLVRLMAGMVRARTMTCPCWLCAMQAQAVELTFPPLSNLCS